MAILVACGWAGQCCRRSLGHLGRSRVLKKLKNAKKVIVAKALDGQQYPLHNGFRDPQLKK